MMIEIPKNKLWAYPTNGENLKKAEKYAHFFADRDHILIISDAQPEGAMEVKGELLRYLNAMDMRWIMEESNYIFYEQEQKYHDEIIKAQDEFLQRFEAELIRAQQEADDDKEGSGAAAESSGKTE